MNRYTSAVFTAYTDAHHNASFSQQGVKVVVPYTPGSDAGSQYRAIVKLIWYKANGKVLGTAKERVDWYASYQSIDTIINHHVCYDWD